MATDNLIMLGMTFISGFLLGVILMYRNQTPVMFNDWEIPDELDTPEIPDSFLSEYVSMSDKDRHTYFELPENIREQVRKYGFSNIVSDGID